MAKIPLSLAEKTFILHGLDADFRNDGRRRCEYRSMEIETKILPQANGSARIRMGNTDVLVSVKLEIDTPIPERPHEGKLEFFVDCSANATPQFEGKGGDDLATEISNILVSAYQSPYAFDLKSLSIISHKKCWKMYIDVLILECGGNLYDVIGAAVKGGLYSTEIPRITAATLDGGEADIQLSDDPYDNITLHDTNFPAIVTVCKIGDNLVVDPTTEEEMCSSASIVMSVMPNGKVTSVIKVGSSSLQPSTLEKVFEMGSAVGKQLNLGLMNALKKERELGPKRPIIGFLR
ncbi:exosome complex exonuclease RRP42 [Prorops nasuta]|uniref:exosome complex exonuclease RRP42 n=1 Tax=Prorops nasuta TaxID=863751 RepID=UPI0034CD8E24